MNRKSIRFSRRRATTLVEAIAGLVILSTILAAVFVARGRFVRQQVLAQRKLQAVHSLDALVAEWMQGSTPSVPMHASGALPGTAGQIWRTNVVPNLSAQSLNARVVRVEVFDPSDRQPIVALELLVHVESPAEGRS